MFEYFPDNYGWSLTTMMAIEMGGQISEIDELCRPLRSVAGAKDANAEALWHQAWRGMAERLQGLAEADEERGDSLGASRKWLRAALYYLVSERHLDWHLPSKLETYRIGLEAFRHGIELSSARVEFVDVPFGDDVLPSLFLPADGVEPAPCMIHFDGLDVMKEFIYLMHGYDLPRRGVSLLICDHPGVGEALRIHGLRSTPETEHPAGACLDYLETRADVDADRVGIMALSMGGYYAPRAAAFEKRLRCCIAWGAIWDLDACLENCRQLGTESVPFEYQLSWVTGVEDPDELRAYTARYTLAGIADRIECPLLVVHGENDQQAPLWTAERTYDEAVNSPDRELKVFRLSEGGAEHCHCDNITMGTDYMHHWAARVLGAQVPDRAGAQT
jgi:dienelactone hydrolase